MKFITICICFILALLSTIVMSYISMATPIGPWIGPTLVLCGMLLFSLFPSTISDKNIILSTIGGSIGGILATACGFAFPALYFLDASLFNSWMLKPVYFVSFMSVLAYVAGWYGIWIANVTEEIFIEQNKLPFPIGQMIYKMVQAHTQFKKAIELAIGFLSTLIFGFLQDGLLFFRAIIPKSIIICNAFAYYCLHIPTVHLELWPMLWAVGFVTGHMIVLPLLIGSLSKISIAQPIHYLYFNDMRFKEEFILAFCSGMVMSGAISGLVQSLQKGIKKIGIPGKRQRLPEIRSHINQSHVIEALLLAIAIGAFLTYVQFNVLMQFYLVVFTFICTYQIILIAGKIGLAQLGRFATFVLVPALFMFNLNALQITVISTFVEVCAGVAVDVLFGRKVVQLGNIDHNQAKRFQYFGLIVSSLSVGIVFWLLINHFTLGSPELVAQRAQARQLLVHVQQFNVWVVGIGVLYGLFLKKIKVSPMLVLGGLLMPLNLTIGLVIGGLGTLLVTDKQAWYPFWSGVFAANSIWMLIKTML